MVTVALRGDTGARLHVLRGQRTRGPRCPLGQDTARGTAAPSAGLTAAGCAVWAAPSSPAGPPNLVKPVPSQRTACWGHDRKGPRLGTGAAPPYPHACGVGARPRSCPRPRPPHTWGSAAPRMLPGAQTASSPRPRGPLAVLRCIWHCAAPPAPAGTDRDGGGGPRPATPGFLHALLPARVAWHSGPRVPRRRALARGRCRGGC